MRFLLIVAMLVLTARADGIRLMVYPATDYYTNIVRIETTEYEVNPILIGHPNLTNCLPSPCDPYDPYKTNSLYYVPVFKFSDQTNVEVSAGLRIDASGILTNHFYKTEITTNLVDWQSWYKFQEMYNIPILRFFPTKGEKYFFRVKEITPGEYLGIPQK